MEHEVIFSEIQWVLFPAKLSWGHFGRDFTTVVLSEAPQKFVLCNCGWTRSRRRPENISIAASRRLNKLLSVCLIAKQVSGHGSSRAVQVKK